MVILLVNVCVPAHTRAPLLLFWISEFELVCHEVSVFKQPRKRVEVSRKFKLEFENLVKC